MVVGVDATTIELAQAEVGVKVQLTDSAVVKVGEED
jgi:hypothetical protein